MVEITLMTTLCVLALVFYVRFLVGLCKEYHYRRICCLVRLQTGPDKTVSTNARQFADSIPRAA